MMGVTSAPTPVGETGFATWIDFRNVVQSKIFVDRNIVDAPIDDLSAPASVRSAWPGGVPGGGSANLQPIKAADHVWFLPPAPR